jgi:post-segregation antitoxin (ccd killing protein)
MAGDAPNIDPELLALCREAGVAVDAVIDQALRAALKTRDTSVEDARAAKWAKDSGDAMAEYNRRVEANKKA